MLASERRPACISERRVNTMTKEEARARLKKQIKAEYGTEKAFAAAMGWQRQKVSYLVNGHYVTNVREVNQIAAALRMDMRELLDALLAVGKGKTAGGEVRAWNPQMKNALPNPEG